MKTAEFDYQLPSELIAQQPAAKRDHSRLMVLHRDSQTIEHRYFYEITEYLQPRDLLVINDTKVMPANLVGIKEGSGGKVEVLLVGSVGSGRKGLEKGRGRVWECLVKPGKRLQVGSRVIFGKGELVGTVLEKTESGEQIIRFEGDLERFMRRHGEIPLPPYIKNSKSETLKTKQYLNSKSQLSKRYQTVYADKEGASASPTAGLHFTKPLLNKIKHQGVKVAHVTLHTGLATFKPVYVENVEDHKMYTESFEVPAATIRAVREAKRVIAVGTTSVRSLEAIYNSPPLSPSLVKRGGGRSLSLAGGELKGETNLFIYPGYKFKVVDAIVTNFHWPRTSLIMLVSAFAGKDFIKRAYQEAIEKKYRFFSFGDAMLIL